MVFTVAWMWLGFVDGGEVDGIVVALFLATVANAYAVTWIVWHRLVPRDAWSFARGVGTGLAIGVVAHATIGFAWALVAFASDGWSASPLDALGVGVAYSLYSVPMTLGIPIVLSVGVALGLTYCRQVADVTPTARK